MTAAPAPLRFCIITSAAPARLAKTITLADDGVTLHKQSSASLTDGVAHHRVAAGLEGLAAVLDGLTPAHAAGFRPGMRR